MNLAIELAGIGAWGLASLRWLRVAQREHYLPGSASRFALRWWLRRPPNPWLANLAVVAAGVALVWPLAAVGAAAAVAAGPLGLGLRGRTSALAWTPRLRRLAAAGTGLEVAVLVVGHLLSVPAVAAAASALLAPCLLDAALTLVGPLERRASETFVRRAREKMSAVSPTVVAITGSYGKTSTKEHVRDLLAGSFEVVASPASFNNRLGLARTVNDELGSGVEVFVAEMGTYAKGEIADLCAWIPPTVGVLTAVGPVHLERFGSREAIAAAKAEILAGVDTAVVNADEPLVTAAAERHAPPAALIRCSVTDPGADVYACRGDDGIEVRVQGEAVGAAPADLFPMNVACAVGVAVALDVPAATLAARLGRLAAPAHRQEIARTGQDVTVIDDTYNSNPAGAAAALDRLARLGAGDRGRIVVTPGMVELGPEQAAANEAFAAEAARIATDLVIVGFTNRAALVAGARGGAAAVSLVRNRHAAVEWVRAHVGCGDVVLYENDLPDHYP